MDSTNGSLIERVENSIKQLSSAAQDLNTVSGELGKAITAIDTVLQSLNIGVATWTRINGGSDPSSESYWHRDLGYAKVSNRWGIALRDVSGDGNRPDDENYDSWLFNDAPRWLRIEGVAKIPDLIEDLIKNTQETTKKIKTKTAEVNELATVIAQAARNEKKASGAHLVVSPIASPRPPGYVAPPLDAVPVSSPLGDSGIPVPSLNTPSSKVPIVPPTFFGGGTGATKKPKGGK